MKISSTSSINVMMLWIYWFDLYLPLFHIINNNGENIYCECKGKIFRFLNSFLQESLFLEFVIILIIIFWIQNINTVGQVTPENTKSHNRVYVGKIDHPSRFLGLIAILFFNYFLSVPYFRIPQYIEIRSGTVRKRLGRLCVTFV